MQTGQQVDRLSEIIDRLESIGDIPTIPVVATRAMDAARDPDSSMRDIAEIISIDPPLASRVLRIVNSAYYSLRQSVGSLPLALTILGIREIIDLVMGISIMTIFPGTSGSGFFDRNMFWKHSGTCAHVAKFLSEKLGHAKLSSEAFVGGLLHDIGKVVMDQYMHEEFREALELSVTEGLSHYDAESMTVGATHPQIGAWLIKKWKLPDILVNAVSCHHFSESIDESEPIQQIVYCANIICLAMEAERPVEEITEILHDDPVWDLCSRSARRKIEVNILLEKLFEEIERTCHFIGGQ